MMSLEQILEGISPIQIEGNPNPDITGIEFDSRNVKDGTLFAAVKGTRSDGHHYIDQAVAQGASAIVCEVLPDKIHPSVTYVMVPDSARALGIMASAVAGNPSQSLLVIGITGTNGKTTIATLLYELFESLGYRAGLISTIQNRIHNTIIPATHTTPDPIQLHHLFSQMADCGCQYCFMEVSSHAIDQQRIAGIRFAGGIFTNITHDHLDYHVTFDNYIRAKKRFFDDLPASAFALINSDDRHSRIMVQNCRAQEARYGLSSMARFRGKVIENTIQGLHLQINNQDVWFRLIGRFNASNLLAVTAAAILLGEDETTVLSHLSRLQPVEGRFNYLISPLQVTAIVDYAHTPDALRNVLETMNDIRQGEGQLITVVGAGGNRDTTKRPLMAAIACELSNRVILTSDNPRFEDPEKILAEMKAGVPGGYDRNLLVITNRKEAIRAAVALAQPGDFILIAGKGHEQYQEINGVKHPFDDQQILRELFEPDDHQQQG